MKEVDVATARTATSRAMCMAYAKSAPKSGLEYDRRNLQEEISKLTMLISDEGIPLSDEEIMDINEQINGLLQDKHRVEISLKHETGINLVHPISRKTVYFGRAKDIHAKSLETPTECKRKIFETESAPVVPQHIIVKKHISEQSVPKKKLKNLDD